VETDTITRWRIRVHSSERDGGKVSGRKRGRQRRWDKVPDCACQCVARRLRLVYNRDVSVDGRTLVEIAGGTLVCLYNPVTGCIQALVYLLASMYV
jgi:hypothetical protein